MKAEGQGSGSGRAGVEGGWKRRASGSGGWERAVTQGADNMQAESHFRL